MKTTVNKHVIWPNPGLITESAILKIIYNKFKPSLGPNPGFSITEIANSFSGNDGNSGLLTNQDDNMRVFVIHQHGQVF